MLRIHSGALLTASPTSVLTDGVQGRRGALTRESAPGKEREGCPEPFSSSHVTGGHSTSVSALSPHLQESEQQSSLPDGVLVRLSCISV